MLRLADKDAGTAKGTAKLQKYIENTITHEMGHVLGLDDITDSNDSDNLMFQKKNLDNPGSTDLSQTQIESAEKVISK